MSAERDWDEWTNTYETQRRLDLIFGDLLRDIDLGGASFLDAGCGGGHFSARAAQRGARVVSMDVGTHLLSQVARRCASTGTVGSVLQLPFPDASFDVVLSTEVVEHTTDPLAAVAAIARMVKPGGWLVLTTPGRLWQPVVRLASVLRLRPYQGYENFVWPHQARSAVQQQGFVVDRFEGFNLLPLFHPAFAGLHGLMDRVGTLLPWTCVNFALRGRRSDA
jgi:2-polyprenyl-6-hydroxyphenyl methylase/3-demethylubiquinone-9 3-methyltransferase